MLFSKFPPGGLDRTNALSMLTHWLYIPCDEFFSRAPRNWLVSHCALVTPMPRANLTSNLRLALAFACRFWWRLLKFQSYSHGKLVLVFIVMMLLESLIWLEASWPAPGAQHEAMWTHASFVFVRNFSDDVSTTVSCVWVCVARSNRVHELHVWTEGFHLHFAIVSACVGWFIYNKKSNTCFKAFVFQEQTWEGS